MDPISAFGIASGALQTIHVISSSIINLQNLRGKYSEAEQTIQSLIVELSTIKTALHRLTHYCHIQGQLDHPDCLSDLRVAVEGCQVAMEVFSDEISRLLRGSSPDGHPLGESLGFRTRMRIAWNDQLMNDLHQRLHSQVLALNLLLQACQCHTPSEQLELLRREDNRRLIERVAGETATLRSTRSDANSRIGTATASVQNSGLSSISRTSLSFDGNMADSDAYRWVMNHQSMQSRSGEDGVDVSGPGSSQPQLLITARGDGSRASGSAQSPSPVPDCWQASRDRRDVPRSKPTALARASSSAKQNSRRSRSAAAPTLLKFPVSKRGLIRSAMERVSSRRGGVGSSPSSSTTDTRPLKRSRQSESSVCIDINSVSGVTAPPIVKAAQAGDIKQVEIQIESGANIEARHDDSGRTALAVAAHCGREEVVRLLLLKNAKIDAKDSCMMTPLHLAASRGHCGVLEALIREDIDVDAKDYKGRTAFWITVDAGYPEAAKVILDGGGAINSRAMDQMTALHRATRQGDREMVLFLLRCNHVDVHAKDSRMRAAIHDAAEAGQTQIVEILLKNGSSIEATGEFQATPLIFAAAMGHLLTTKTLLRKGAFANARDDKGMTALHWAAFKGYDEIVEQLVKRKVPMNLTDRRGCTPLHLATCASQFHIAECLLRQGASTESRCLDGYTPLHYACNTGNIELVRLLLYSKANIEAQIKGSGRRAVHLIAYVGSLEIFKLLQAKGADIDCADLSGFTPLCVASKYGHFEVVNWLLASGVFPRSQTAYHISPVRLAAMEGRAQIVTRLLDAGASPSECDDSDWNPILHGPHYGQIGIPGCSLRRNIGSRVSELSADLAHCSIMQRRGCSFVLPPASTISSQQGGTYDAPACRLLISPSQEVVPLPYELDNRNMSWVRESSVSGGRQQRQSTSTDVTITPPDSPNTSSLEHTSSISPELAVSVQSDSNSLSSSLGTEDGAPSLQESLSDNGSHGGCEDDWRDGHQTPTMCQRGLQPLIEWERVGKQDGETTDSDSVKSFHTAHEYSITAAVPWEV